MVKIKDVKNDLKKVETQLTDCKGLKVFINEVLNSTRKENQSDKLAQRNNSQANEDLEDPSNFFITKSKKSQIQNENEKQSSIPMNPKQFKKLIMNLKKENLFVIGLINEEEKL